MGAIPGTRKPTKVDFLAGFIFWVACCFFLLRILSHFGDFLAFFSPFDPSTAYVSVFTMVSSPAVIGILSLLLTPFVEAQTCTPCDDVHFFLARGNNEPYPGRQGDLVAATCDGLASCGYENLIYSALYTDLSCQTTYDGTQAGFKQLTSYADRCPKSKLILAGYSQGGQIVADILGGGGGVSFNGCIQPSTPALDRNTSPGNRRMFLNAFVVLSWIGSIC